MGGLTTLLRQFVVVPDFCKAIIAEFFAYVIYKHQIKKKYLLVKKLDATEQLFIMILDFTERVATLQQFCALSMLHVLVNRRCTVADCWEMATNLHEAVVVYSRRKM